MRPLLRYVSPLAIALVLVALISGGPPPAGASDPDGPHLPDLQTLPIVPGVNTDILTQGGVKYLRLDNTVANLGDGPFELVPINNPGAGTTDAYQRVYTHDDEDPWNWSVYSETLVGTFVFHLAHNHWHFDDFAVYELREVAKGGGISNVVVAASDKVSFCIINVGYVPGASQLEHYEPSMTYSQCGQNEISGLSVGAFDTYNRTLPDQRINIQDVPPGQYWLVSTADPSDRIDETDETNNTTAVLVDLPGPSPSPTVTPTPSPSPTPTATPTATAAPSGSEPPPTPTPTATPDPSATPTPTPTATPSGSQTATQPPTDDPRPTDTPEPTPTATPTPGPTGIATPSPNATPVLVKGSPDCDLDVDSIDALIVLREVAGMAHIAGCIESGDVNCDAALEALDAQLILRHIAALAVDLPNGCPPIGTLV
jgi:hypothetical protein